ncbi:MAG: TatD family hydrolase [Candidatus Paceibacterota bacterium]|jgi:TatD DNase family protein
MDFTNLLYFDIHSHLNLPEFKDDLDEVIKRMEDNKVGTIVVGADFETSKKAVEIAENNEHIFASVGIHPSEVNKNFDFKLLEKLAGHNKVVAIGECGLDYFHDGGVSIEDQRECFIRQIEIANELNKPLMLHIRNNPKDKTKDAYKDTLEILKQYAEVHPEKGGVKGNVHFFAGNLEAAKNFTEFGFSISFTGVITFSNDYDEVIKNIPIEMIMPDTDCPYVAPVPYRGKRNEPIYVKEIVKKIAEIKDLPEDEVAKIMILNTRRVFDF